MRADTSAASRAGRRAKSARVDFRLSPEQKVLLDEAATLSGTSLSEFVLQSAQAAANDVLADRTRFILPPERWAAFADALTRPPRHLPRLAALLSSPSVIDDE